MNTLELWRGRRSLSIQELADQSGVNRATINRIEHGTVTPSTKTLGKLAAALAIDVSELADLVADQPGQDSGLAYRPDPEELEELLERIAEDERGEGELYTLDQVRAQLAAFKAELRAKRSAAGAAAGRRASA